MNARFAAFDLLTTLTLVVQPDGAVLFANTAFEDQMRLSRRAAQRGMLFDWFEDRGRVHEALEAVAQRRVDVSRFEAQLLRQPGEAALAVWVSVSQSDAPHELLVEMMEATAQARQERDERHADQLRSSKDLIRNLAHEIKNPLGGLRGAAQLLALELGPQSELLEYTQVIVGEADRLQSLVDRLLAPHRHAPQVSDVNIHEVCERVRSLILGKQRWRLALELHVEDNGPGVPPEIRDRLFFPLVSGREGGTGLGLHLAQTIVQAHQGTIDCDSQPGRTDFCLTIPLP